MGLDSDSRQVAARGVGSAGELVDRPAGVVLRGMADLPAAMDNRRRRPMSRRNEERILTGEVSEDEVDRSMRSAGEVRWCGGGWIDEGRKQAIVVRSGFGLEDEQVSRLFRIVDIESSKVRNASAEVVRTALAVPARAPEAAAC